MTSHGYLSAITDDNGTHMFVSNYQDLQPLIKKQKLCLENSISAPRLSH